MKKIESGRSMIEMLGVLAIIGVLSIGGLAAYQSAMNRNTANEIVNDASTCLVLAKSDSKTGPCYGDGAILDKTAPVTNATIAASKNATTGVYSVLIGGVTGDVLDAIKDRVGTDLTIADNE